MSLSTFRGLDYAPQDADDEVLLSEMPLSVLKGSIEKQFDDPIEYMGHDFVQSFITKYHVTKETYTEEEDFEELAELYDSFINFMESIFQTKLGIGLPELDNMGEDDQLELIHYIYRFFIINVKRNFSKFLFNWIEENKDEIADDLPKRKDVSTNSLREYIDNSNDLAILSNLASVIDMAIEDDTIDVDKFLNLSRGNGANLENDYISEHYDTFDITGNFVESYSKLLKDSLRVELECKLRNKLLKKYRKK